VAAIEAAKGLLQSHPLAVEAPFSFLYDHSDGLGAIQTGLYRLMVELELEVELGPAYVVHFSDDTYFISKMKYFKVQLEEWLIGS
jgi:hypothetical protein